MMKTSAFQLLLLASVMVAVVSCSSGDQKEETASPDVADATSGSTDTPPPAELGTSPDQGMASPETAAADATPTAETSEADLAAGIPPADPNAAPPSDATAAPVDSNAPPEAGATDTTKNEPPPAEPQGDLFGAGAGATDTVPTGDVPPPSVPKKMALSHVRDMPFNRGGQLLNTVYIARDGDTLDLVSQRLFAEDKTKSLKKANPTLKRGVKVGDKIYFNSPNRADDKDKMLVVYEDQGLPPSTYTTKEGDTLKSLAQEWYGTEGSYKEIYAINRGLASPKELLPGTELQYWPASATVAAYGMPKNTEVAMNAPAPAGNPPPPSNNMPPPPTSGGNMPPTAGSMNNTIPPPPSNNMLPPPPPAEVNAMPPPPPPPIYKRKKDLGTPDKDTMMYAGVAGILLLGTGALIAVRRRASRKNQGVTQV